MKKIFFLFVFTFFIFHSTFGVTWKTILPGFWNSPSVWLGGSPPPFVCGDTILVQHPIVATNTITLTSGAHLIIDNYGGICGHEQMIVQSNAKVIKYGIFEMDVLTVPGGDVVFNMPGNWKLSYYGIISNGGTFHINGAGGAVGPWFDCQMPEYSFLTGLNEDEISNEFSVFPNPSSGSITFSIDFSSDALTLQLVNTAGALIYEKNVQGNSTVNINGLAPGMYFCYTQEMNSSRKIRTKIIVTE